MTPAQTGMILIVDDDDAMRAICRRMVQVLGYTVVEASNGEEAMQRMAETPADFVLTDIHMPGSPLDGVQLVDEIRRRYPSTDVVMMTALPSLGTAIPALKSGAYDYLVKPFDPQMLIALVNRCFEKRRLTVELDKERRLRQELEAAYQELQKVEELRESIIGRVNHELRTPLIPILMGLNQLKIERFDPAERKAVDWIRGGALHLQRLIEELLHFAEVRHPGLVPQRVPTNLETMFAQITSDYRPLWEDKRLRVEVHFAPDATQIEADPRLLLMAFKHLFFNAIQFNRVDGAIRIEAVCDHSHVHFAFSDTGIGIPADKVSKVFDSFYQVAEYLTREVGGLGLGLAIVRRVVEAHGGLVSVEANPDGGTRFHVYLPLAANRTEALVEKESA
jgi:signal transduction histidine kinase